MWIVRLALRRPYTFIVLAMLIVLVGVSTVLRMPADMFPQINIPVVAAIWQFTGLPPMEMEGRITSQFERAATTTVSGIEHIESQTLAGVSVVKIYMQPGTSMAGAVAQVAAVSQPILRQLPPGATPPLVMAYSASSVPILQLGLSSPTLSEQEIFDLGMNFLRPGLATVQGAQLPLPVGGKVRQVVVDLDLQKLFAWGLSPADISTAVNTQNVILPSGTAKIGPLEYPIVFNGSPSVADGLNDLPLKKINGSIVHLRDVAHVRDGYMPQTSVVLTNGTRGALIPVLSAEGASTLNVVAGVRAALPQVQATLPPQLEIKPLFDQSIFVKGAISGMALAVGILVDDATVTLENYHLQRSMKKPLGKAILDGAAEIAVPTLVSTLCICIVFVPVVLISGAARSLFIPLAMAVVFAMLTSYFLSRTLVPTLIRYLLAREEHGGGRGPIAWLSARVERGFERLRDAYGRALQAALRHRKVFITSFVAFVAVSLCFVPLLGRDFFPSVDAGQMRLHVRGPPGTRIEETQRLFAGVEERVRKIVPADELDVVIDDIGVPVSGINLALGDPSMISSADGEMLISLKPKHGPTAGYVHALRKDLASTFSQATFFFLAADISTQILNFGLSSPVDVRLTGPAGNQAANLAIARDLASRIATVPGAVDVHLAQVTDTPELLVDVDRTVAQDVGLTMRDVASDLLISLSSSSQTAPNFWMDPKTGVQYPVAVQTPQVRVDSIQVLETTPLSSGTVRLTSSGSYLLPTAASTLRPELLSNVASVSHVLGPTNITHYNIARTIDVQAGVDGADLASVASGVQKLIDQVRPKLPRGSTILLTGQPQAMNASFSGLGIGIVAAVILVYLLMAVNFQSWTEPLVILMALPGTLAGIVWGLFVTGTTLSVPALMGTLMSIGVATANSILIVTFAIERLREGADSVSAALNAGRTRLRPVIMTATAMILGMLPMSLGLGDGGEQNAPLGRAVIGGLVFATLSTLFFVPLVLSAIGYHPPAQVDEAEPDAEPARGTT